MTTTTVQIQHAVRTLLAQVHQTAQLAVPEGACEPYQVGALGAVIGQLAAQGEAAAVLACIDRMIQGFQQCSLEYEQARIGAQLDQLLDSHS